MVRIGLLVSAILTPLMMPWLYWFRDNFRFIRGEPITQSFVDNLQMLIIGSALISYLGNLFGRLEFQSAERSGTLSGAAKGAAFMPIVVFLFGIANPLIAVPGLVAGAAISKIIQLVLPDIPLVFTGGLTLWLEFAFLFAWWFNHGVITDEFGSEHSIDVTDKMVFLRCPEHGSTNNSLIGTGYHWLERSGKTILCIIFLSVLLAMFGSIQKNSCISEQVFHWCLDFVFGTTIAYIWIWLDLVCYGWKDRWCEWFGYYYFAAASAVLFMPLGLMTRADWVMKSDLLVCGAVVGGQLFYWWFLSRNKRISTLMPEPVALDSDTDQLKLDLSCD